ncbi:MAG: transposase [Deltaproteobacteria bacterium]|nr:transposase [Deltaproteobacteria bacterium]
MARKARVHFEGALYHVICRGNQKQLIFSDDRDRQRYVDLLKESQQRFRYLLYAYVLMGNHVHHLLEIGQTPLSKVMQNILFRYTRYWNWRYQKTGHLFQGRYKAILCEKESYLLELIRYLHLNPVRSGIVKDPRRYAWSSHGAYLEGGGSGWIAVEKVLPRWGSSRRQAVAGYQRFVWEGLRKGHRADFYEVVDQRYLGDDEFVDRLEKRVLEREPPQVVEIEWAEVKERVCREFGVLAGAVLHRGRGRKNVRIKRVMAWVGREVGGFTYQLMAKELSQDPAVLSRGLSKLSDEIRKERDLQIVVEKLCNSLRKGRRPKRSLRLA